ncbi:MAG: triose-phosphate isomerase [Candidatus Hydrogenedentes bacterium]|nr:triose-phosphate isomerase [Candidatus Hydrogenedentota bacterium]
MSHARTPLIAGNWKMYKKIGEGVDLVRQLTPQVAGVSKAEIVVCPTFTALQAVGQAVQGTNIALGAQNCYLKAEGAFTGEISPQMLLDAGCTWTIIGHSERRQIFHENDKLLNQKLRFALESGLKVMFCIGETLEERENGNMDDILERQVHEGLSGLNEADFGRLAIAYEPVWAIGTGVTATPEQAEDAHAFVRGLIGEHFHQAIAEALRIQYGGSVKPDNAAELIAKQNVDGFLVGGASLKADSFAAIVKAGAGQ